MMVVRRSILLALIVGAVLLIVVYGGLATRRQAEIATAVEATLTAIAGKPTQGETAGDATPAPQGQTTDTRQTITLPPPIPNWQAIDKPTARKGSSNAPVTIVEYSDFQCPWCLRFHQQVMPQLEPLIEAGGVRFVYKHFPVLGPASLTTALAAECAGIQGDFWKLHDWLFDNHSAWKGQPDVRQVVLDAAAQLGYDADALSACMDADTTLEAIRAEFQETQQYGFRGTPSFIINGRLVPGFLPWEQFGLLVEASLAETQGKPLPPAFAATNTPPPPDR